MNRYKEEEREKYILEADNISSIIKNKNIDSFLLGFVLTWFFVKGSPKKYKILRNKLKGFKYRDVCHTYYAKKEELDRYGEKACLYTLRISFPSEISEFKRKNSRIINICLRNKMLTEENMK